MGRRNPDRYTLDDWRLAGGSVAAIIANRWFVFTECELCELRMKADLRRIAQEKGGTFSLWGRTAACRRLGCPGRVTFFCQPHGADPFAMTAPQP